MTRRNGREGDYLFSGTEPIRPNKGVLPLARGNFPLQRWERTRVGRSVLSQNLTLIHFFTFPICNPRKFVRPKPSMNLHS